MTSEKMSWSALERSVRVPIRFHTTPTRLDYARFFQVEPQTIDRWKRNGIPWHTADRIACQFVGVHPGSIWEEWWPA